MPTPAGKIQSAQSTAVGFYDLHQVARFLHSVAYAATVDNNIKVVPKGFLSGGDELIAGDPHRIRAEGDCLASLLMTRSLELCEQGSVFGVEAFLKHQKFVYLSSCRSIDSKTTRFQDSNAWQKWWNVAEDLAHIVHGIADATGEILSFAPLEGAGNTALKRVLAVGLPVVDEVISKPSESRGKIIGVAIVKQVAERAHEIYFKRARATLVNMVTRDWKYVGAFHNAQVRLQTQSGLTVGFFAVHVYLAAKHVGDDLKEVQDHSHSLATLRPTERYHVVQAPDLRIPDLHLTTVARPPRTSTKVPPKGHLAPRRSENYRATIELDKAVTQLAQDDKSGLEDFLKKK